MKMNPDQDSHLSEDELFRLAVPAVGEPEALPAHLMECAACGQALQEWKRAVRGLAEEDEAALDRRSPEEWRAAEDRTLEAIRRAGLPGRRARRLPWTVGLAASLLLAVLLLTGRNSPAPPVPALDDAAELSEQDRADDTLLREVALAASGEDRGGIWNSLAPDPDAPAEEEESL